MHYQSITRLQLIQILTNAQLDNVGIIRPNYNGQY